MGRLKILSLVIILLLVALGAVVWLLASSVRRPAVTGQATPEVAVVVFATEAPTPTRTATLIPTPAPSPSAASSDADLLLITQRPADINPLTGLKMQDPALLRRRPLMVRIGNDPGARPQVGLNEADVVYEELVEWWITRFTAVFLSQDPEIIAPIRSARLINLQLTTQYQAALANSGGSDAVRWELSQADLVNLDEFFVPQPYFYRENEGWQTRLALDGKVARVYMKSEGLESAVNLRGFAFSEKLDPARLPAAALADARTVVIPYPPSTSEARWEYDPASGKYLRFTTDEPMLDFAGNRIAAANVIIYFAEHQDTDIVEDSNGATSVRIIVNGRGTAWLARDGKILKGYWETDGRQTPNFTFEDGRLMPLKPGNTWVQVVPLDYLIEIDGVDQPRGKDAPAGTRPGDLSPTRPAGTSTPTATPIGFRAPATPVPALPQVN